MPVPSRNLALTPRCIRGKRQECSEALEKYPVVAHEIDDSDGRLALGRAQTTPQLLQEHDAGLGRPQHDDAIYCRDIDAFVEHIDGAHRIEFATARVARAPSRGRQNPRRRTPRPRAGLAFAQPLPHVHGVRDAAAEHQRSCARMLLPGTPEGLHPGFGLRRRRERLRIEASVPPRNVLVVDLVLDAEVVKRNEASKLDTARYSGREGNQVVEQTEDVRGIRAIRRGRQPKQEMRVERIEDAAVGIGSGMVDLVDDDVVEVLRVKTLEGALAATASRPMRRPVQHAARPRRRRTSPLWQSRLRRANQAAVCVGGLAEELAAMGKEEETRSTSELLAKLRIVECCEPGLAEASSEHDERSAVTLRANVAQTRECFDLHRVRGRRYETAARVATSPMGGGSGDRRARLA